MTETPTADVYKRVIGDLSGDPRTGVAIRSGSHRLGPILIGLELEVMESALACLSLMNGPLGDTAMPIARKCFEYGVVAQWLNLTKDADAYFAVSDGHSRKLDRQTRDAGRFLPPEVLAELDEAAPKTPRSSTLSRFEKVCMSFEDGAGLYLLYRHLSAPCHPWLDATSRWLRQEDNAIGFGFYKPEPLDPRVLLWPVTAGLLWSARALDIHTRDQPRKAALQAAGRAIDIKTVLKPA